MAKLNVRGNALMEQLSKDLDFPFKRIGSLVVCKDEEDMPNLKALYDRCLLYTSFMHCGLSWESSR